MLRIDRCGSISRAAATEWEGTIGYILHPEVQGRGLAGEVARELLAIAFEDLGLRRVLADAYVENVASCRVLDRGRDASRGDAAGGLVGQGRGWLDLNLYALLHDEWTRERVSPAPTGGSARGCGARRVDRGEASPTGGGRRSPGHVTRPTFVQSLLLDPAVSSRACQGFVHTCGRGLWVPPGEPCLGATTGAAPLGRDDRRWLRAGCGRVAVRVAGQAGRVPRRRLSPECCGWSSNCSLEMSTTT